MLSGEGCPMCADAHLVSNEHGDLLVASPVSYTRLHKNQKHAGYSVVILNRHVPELHQLDDAELRQFWIDVTRLSRVRSGRRDAGMAFGCERIAPSCTWVGALARSALRIGLAGAVFA
jgi:hypothetical protein